MVGSNRFSTFSVRFNLYLVSKDSVKYSKNKQIAINMVATFMAFVVNFGVSFFLTPFIVRNLGTEAYGFIGLTTNFISYTQLITIALNSMAGRFISISYIEGDVESANKYFTSVFYANLILSAVILLILIFCVGYLEYLIDIPAHLVVDAKGLLCLLVFSSVLGLMTNVYAIAAFIKNRLELTSVRDIISKIIYAATLIIAFTFFSPHIWYIGLAGVLTTAYVALTNRAFTRKLTSDLIIRRSNFDLDKVKELMKSGSWNVISKLGEILGQGLDLLIANICIGATAMGFFALTKNVPLLILSLFQMIAAVFAPILTQLYAQGKKEELLLELNKTIRILGFFTTIPLACLYVIGGDFYSLWLPTEDSNKLQLLTVLGTIGMTFSMPLESLWNIFTITNKLKYSTLVMLANNIIVFSTVMASMIFVDSPENRLLILAGSRSAWGMLRSLSFLPMYGAYCLNINKSFFYPAIFKSIICMMITLVVSFFMKQFITIDSWLTFVIAGLIIVFISVLINTIVVSTKNDRKIIFGKILNMK